MEEYEASDSESDISSDSSAISNISDRIFEEEGTGGEEEDIGDVLQEDQGIIPYRFEPILSDQGGSDVGSDSGASDDGGLIGHDIDRLQNTEWYKTIVISLFLTLLLSCFKSIIPVKLLFV